MLTGLIPPSSGDVFVLGKSVRDELPRVRTSLGVCPQQNVLFPRLTVLEHLRLFAVLKGVPHGRVAGAAERRIAALNLQDKARKATQIVLLRLIWMLLLCCSDHACLAMLSQL